MVIGAVAVNHVSHESCMSASIYFLVVMNYCSVSSIFIVLLDEVDVPLGGGSLRFGRNITVASSGLIEGLGL